MGICGSSTKPQEPNNGQKDNKDGTTRNTPANGGSRNHSLVPEDESRVKKDESNPTGIKRNDNNGTINVYSIEPADIEKQKNAERMKEIEKQAMERKERQIQIEKEKELERERQEKAEKQRSEALKKEQEMVTSNQINHTTLTNAYHVNTDKTSVKNKPAESHDNSFNRGEDAHGGRKDKKKQKFREVLEDKESGYYEHFTKIEKKMGTEDVAYIVSCLMGHFFFSNLSNEELYEWSKIGKTRLLRCFTVKCRRENMYLRREKKPVVSLSSTKELSVWRSAGSKRRKWERR